MASTNHWIGEKYHQYSNQQKWVADRLIDQYTFHPGQHVLDVGCGDGKITHNISQKVPEGSVTGIDPSISMIEFAKKKYEDRRVRFDLGMASQLSFSEEFDLITSFSSLHWEPNQREALACFRRALRKDGAVLLAIPGPDLDLRSALKTICNTPEWASYFADYQSPGRIWTANEYALLLIDTGFSIRKIEVVDRPYVVGDMSEYRGIVEAMLPHLSQLPSSLHPSFLDQLMELIATQGKRDVQGRPIFDVKVLEVIAYV